MMLKRIAALFFVLFYLLISVGFTVSVHQCNGETAVSIGEAESCCCEGEEADNECCSNMEKLIVWESDYQLSSAFNFEMNVSFEMKAPFVFSFEELILDQVTNLFLDLPPPRLQKIFLLIQRFTFYG